MITEFIKAVTLKTGFIVLVAQAVLMREKHFGEVKYSLFDLKRSNLIILLFKEKQVFELLERGCC